MPTKSSSQKRRRRQRNLSRELEHRLGADQAEIVHRFDDGWTIRRVDRIEDQRREGELMRSCLKGLYSVPSPNCYSLRDPDNLPRVTFAVWATQGRRLPREVLEEIEEDDAYLLAARCLLQLSWTDPVRRPEYLERLRQFGSLRVVDTASPLPLDPFERMWVFFGVANPGSADVLPIEVQTERIYEFIREIRTEHKATA